jgi:SAM-dependent methyltransferase
MKPRAGWTSVASSSPRKYPPGDVFLDPGSGKGRAVLLAARYPFKRVIGVEFSESLTAIARRNMATFRARLRCHDVELVTADVVDYRIPDDVSVVYMFNLFHERLVGARSRPHRIGRSGTPARCALSIAVTPVTATASSAPGGSGSCAYHSDCDWAVSGGRRRPSDCMPSNPRRPASHPPMSDRKRPSLRSGCASLAERR